MKELKTICETRRRELNLEGETVNEVNPLAAIKEQITALATIDKLEKIETNLKEEFKVIFQPIPHVDELPTDVVARIKLKDAHQTIAACTYSCPRKFWEAWQTLIQQHLDSGNLSHPMLPHPSSSQKPTLLSSLDGSTTIDN
jgi:hypothetical protein